MNVAEGIAKEDPKALSGLITLFGRSAQARAMGSWINRGDNFHYNESTAMFSRHFPITRENLTLEDVSMAVLEPVTLSLGRDLIFPWPWEGQRLVKCLANLRPGGMWGSWAQDQDNHCVEWWLPLGIGWVHGGNHSITTGILYGQGHLTPDFCFDISEVYNHVRCDGLFYTRIHDGKKIAAVSDFDFAAIFEIGRLIVCESN
jgi:hypothetical protein